MDSVEVNPEGPGKSIFQFYNRLNFVKYTNFSASVCGDHKEYPESVLIVFDKYISKRIFDYNEIVFLSNGYNPNLDLNY